MKQNYKIFMLVAEEQSISKAAEKAFVTQQCVSDHIKRLEKEFNVTLFERKPYFHLTSTGEIMLKYLRNLNTIENNMGKSLKEISEGKKGEFTVGISTSRAQMILPKVLKKYYEYFPDVKVSFYVNDTVVLEEHLLEGSVDLFLGINTSQNSNFQFIPIVNDSMHLIISKELFQKYFGNRELEKFKNGVDLTDFSEVPFSLYYETGALNLVIEQHLLTYGIKLKKTPYYISDCDVHILLCQSGITAGLIPKMLSVRVHEHNSMCKDNEIYIFPIKNFNYPLRMDLVHHKDVELPFYIKSFSEILKSEALKLMEI